MQILLVDDHEDSRELLAMWLTDAGHEVLAAGSVGEARPLLDSGAIDVLLTDIHLPDGDGQELAREVRSRFPNVRCVAVTGDVRTKRDVFDAVLTKPIDLNQLRAELVRP